MCTWDIRIQTTNTTRSWWVLFVFLHEQQVHHTHFSNTQLRMPSISHIWLMPGLKYCHVIHNWSHYSTFVNMCSNPNLVDVIISGKDLDPVSSWERCMGREGFYVHFIFIHIWPECTCVSWVAYGRTSFCLSAFQRATLGLLPIVFCVHVFCFPSRLSSVQRILSPVSPCGIATTLCWWQRVYYWYWVGRTSPLDSRFWSRCWHAGAVRKVRKPSSLYALGIHGKGRFHTENFGPQLKNSQFFAC